jgi:hypothetical protein
MKTLFKQLQLTAPFFLLAIAGFACKLQAQVAPVNIPGTHVSIVLPQGYRISKNFKGIEKNKDLQIKVYDPYNTSYYKYAQSFTRASLENGGSEVEEYKKLTVSGYQGKYAALQNNSGAKTLYLVFGDSSFSVMLIAFCPANRDSDQQQLKASLLSTTFSKSLKTDPFAGAFFNINDTNSDYRFAKCKNDYYIFTSNGTAADEYSGESIVSVLPFTSEYAVGDETIARAILSSYQQYGITDAKTKKETQVQIGSVNAMEAEVNAKIDNKKAVLYRLTLVSGKQAILILGIATSDYEKNMDAFRSLAKTLKFK